MFSISFFILVVAIEAASLQHIANIKQHNTSALALSALVNGCQIKCPNGMTVTAVVACEGRLFSKSDYRKVDKAIKKACFEKYDAMTKEKRITEQDRNYWKAIWYKVESEDNFGCTGGCTWDHKQHIGCRLHDICYETSRRYSELDDVTRDVFFTKYYHRNGRVGRHLPKREEVTGDSKEECDSDQYANHGVVDAGREIIRFGHWVGVSQSAYDYSQKLGKEYYLNHKGNFESCPDECKDITNWDSYYECGATNSYKVHILSHTPIIHWF